jgi:hypothetical protein
LKQRYLGTQDRQTDRQDATIESALTTPETPKTAAIVLKLLEPLVGKGFTLWIDNFYNSPNLALEMKLKHGTDCVGTMKLTRMNVPKEVKENKLKKGACSSALRSCYCSEMV